MKKMLALIGSALCLTILVAVSTARADERETAVKMVKDAVALYKTGGLEKALEMVNDPKGPFVKGSLYVFGYDLNGILIANATAPEKVGQNVIDVPDSKGKKFRRNIIERAQKEQSGWEDYTIINPKSKLEEDKTSYFEIAGDVIFGCGIYKK